MIDIREGRRQQNRIGERRSGKTTFEDQMPASARTRGTKSSLTVLIVTRIDKMDSDVRGE